VLRFLERVTAQVKEQGYTQFGERFAQTTEGLTAIFQKHDVSNRRNEPPRSDRRHSSNRDKRKRIAMRLT
jgi:hypothetical protein